eukprot:4477935-Heterocapsa_arctica.AAC.1
MRARSSILALSSARAMRCHASGKSVTSLSMVAMYKSSEDDDTQRSIRQATAKTRQEACHWM